MKNLLAGNWDEVASSNLNVRKSVSGSVAGYVQWQLERGLKSMSFVERA
jgi:DNA repair protein RecO (recombination protein O)